MLYDRFILFKLKLAAEKAIKLFQSLQLEERVTELEKEKQSDSERISDLETLVLQLGGNYIMNEIILEILKRKIKSGEITVEDIKRRYKGGYC